MTEVEQALARALPVLKSAGYAHLMGVLLAGLASTPVSSEEEAALERMSLTSGAELRSGQRDHKRCRSVTDASRARYLAVLRVIRGNREVHRG
jgi:hypothetical protein